MNIVRPVKDEKELLLASWKVGLEAYSPSLPEPDDACFLAKYRLTPQGCLLCLKDDAIVGYGISHIWDDGIVQLNSIIQKPDKPTCLYIHDVAILPGYRQSGFGSEMLARMEVLAQQLGLHKISLVSVNNSRRFWEKYGFSVLSELKYGPAIDGTMVDGFKMTKNLLT